MKIKPLNLFKKKTKESISTTISNKTYKNFIVRALGFINDQGSNRQGFNHAEFDLEEIKVASLSDSYIKIALSKYSNLMYKAGYTLKSDNEKTTEYLKKRFKIMSFATNKPTDILWQEVADDMVKYSNAFLIKSRVDNVMPGIKAIGIFGKKPIGGYFRVGPETMQIKRDKFGKVEKYKQTVNGEEKEYMPNDVIHMYLDKDANNGFGTPRIQAALEDIKLLRRIEGNVISLIYRFAIPIYQWMIGLPEPGFQATDKEIREAEQEIEKMPLDGVIVTNEKTQIKAIGAEGHALDASKYLEYFEKRAFTALDVSASQMGRGGSKQDADSMEAQTHDTIKHIQRTIGIFIENYILNELLLEGGFNPILNEEDEVKYVFEEISLDTKVKVENHELLKFQSNIITFEEARQSIGKKSEIDEERLYVNMIENESAKRQTELKTDGAIKLADANTQNSLKLNKEDSKNEKVNNLSIAGNGTVKSAKANKAVKTLNNPTNQHGTTSVKISESFDSEEKLRLKKDNHKEFYKDIYISYNNVRNDIVENNEDIDIVFPLGKDILKKEILPHIEKLYIKGVIDAVSFINKKTKTYNLLPNLNLDLSYFEKELDIATKNIFKDISTEIKGTNKKSDIIAAFDKKEYRIRYIIEYLLPKIYWFAYVKTGAHFGIEEAEVIFNKDSKDKEDHNPIIKTNYFSVEDIPAYHSFCKCKVKLKVGEK